VGLDGLGLSDFLVLVFGEEKEGALFGMVLLLLIARERDLKGKQQSGTT